MGADRPRQDLAAMGLSGHRGARGMKSAQESEGASKIERGCSIHPHLRFRAQLQTLGVSRASMIPADPTAIHQLCGARPSG